MSERLMLDVSRTRKMSFNARVTVVVRTGGSAVGLRYTELESCDKGKEMETESARQWKNIHA